MVSTPSSIESTVRESMRKAKLVKGDIGLEACVDPGGISPKMTFRQWCERLAADGIKVDCKPFRLDDRQALIPIHDAIPTTPDEAPGEPQLEMASSLDRDRHPC